MLIVTSRVTVPLAMLGLTLAVTPAFVSAQQAQRFAEAALFFELNDTAGDLGIHAAIDGEPWTDLVIRSPGSGSDGRVLEIVSRGMLGVQGLTQLSFESAEPSFDELRPGDFFRRFPEGQYEIVANGLEGGRISGTASLSHVIAAAPKNVRVNGARAADSCDDSLPTVLSPVTVDWDAVTESHPEIGRRGAITVDRYQLFVENETVKISVDLGPDVTEFEIPEAVTRFGRQFKFEIIVRTDAGNNTAIESCFLVHR